MAIPMQGKTDVPLSIAVEFYKARGAHSRFTEHMLPAIWRNASTYNIPAELAAVVCNHETGGGHYRGVVPPEYLNYGGIKRKSGGGNYDPKAHQVFASHDRGAAALLQYLRAYAEKIVGKPIAPRVTIIKQGSAPTLAEISGPGKYNANPNYGPDRERELRQLRSYAREHGAMADIFGVPFRRVHIPAGNSNRPGGNYKKTHVTWHETANTNPGANAAMHVQFLKNGGGAHNVSFQYVVDDSEIDECLPPYEKAWHAGDGGDGYGNTHSIGVELCVNSDGDFNKTIDNAVKLGAWLEQEHDVQHHFWSGKNCPTNLRRSGWSEFVGRIAAYSHGEKEPTVRVDPVTSHSLSGGFKGYYEWLERQLGEQEALLLIGHPLTGEIEEDGITVQYFERARFEWHPGSRPDRYDVLLGRTGAEVMEHIKDRS